ncbi:MAG: metal-dependent transcriptional regulator [Chitinophagales bacterium]|nr:metal-dependent transcriptional regulator [Chitinophagales bacterium]
MNLSETEENYLKALYYICTDGDAAASTNAISARLETSAASVSDMIKRLADKDLVIYEKYKGAFLSKKGKTIAVGLVRKHRLWEFFLVDKLGFRWDQVHEVAEQLEHVKSPELILKLDQFLGFPKSDPHGDPIPDAAGNIQRLALRKLSSFSENDELILMGVSDSSVEFLQYLNQQGLNLGAKVKLGSKFPFDQSQELHLENKLKVVISLHVANSLLVKKVNS